MSSPEEFTPEEERIAGARLFSPEGLQKLRGVVSELRARGFDEAAGDFEACYDKELELYADKEITDYEQGGEDA
jgi:hypothetical protein